MLRQNRESSVCVRALGMAEKVRTAVIRGRLYPRHLHTLGGMIKAMVRAMSQKFRVPRLCKKIDLRPIEGAWPYLWIDAANVEARQKGGIVSNSGDRRRWPEMRGPFFPDKCLLGPSLQSHVNSPLTRRGVAHAGQSRTICGRAITHRERPAQSGPSTA
jgi:hypothetical protein